MSYARHAIFVALFTATSVLAQGGSQAPVNLKEAEAQGLQRLSVEDLKAFMPGIHEEQGTTGKSTKYFKPDGGFEPRGIKDFTGSWRFDEGRNGYCLDVYKKKGMEKTCFAVFRAPDGTHYFDYEVDTGFYSHVWRRATKE